MQTSKKTTNIKQVDIKENNRSRTGRHQRWNNKYKTGRHQRWNNKYETCRYQREQQI